MGIGILAALGLFIGWAGFHKNARNEFHHEAELDPENAVEESGETFTVSAPAL